ncbi:MAG: divalent-cation tolerance protein CutA [Polyangiaceae bacterium]
MSEATTEPTELRVVLVNVPPADASRIARALVEARLAACVNALPGVTSFYVWQGKLEEESETTLLIKTRASLVPELTAKVRELHSYSVPEVVAVVLERGAGNPAYLDWVVASTRDPS